MRSSIRRFAPLVALVLGSCADESAVAPSAEGRPPPASWRLPNKSRAEQPAHIVVDHILIGVRSQKNRQFLRSKAAAEAFAKDLFEELRSGGNWAEARRLHSEDKGEEGPGGPYGMANDGASPGPKERGRRAMVPAFGDVGFQLEVGEIGLAEYDFDRSPYGFHIIKRTK